MEPTRFATVQEFADLIRQTPKAVYRRIKRGGQPGAFPVGREIRIDLAVALSPESHKGDTGRHGAK